MSTVSEWLGLAATMAGVTRCHGSDLPGLDTFPTPTGCEELYATVDGRLGPGPGVALITDGGDKPLLVISGGPHPEPVETVVSTPGALALAVAQALRDAQSSSVHRIRLDVNPEHEGSDLALLGKLETFDRAAVSNSRCPVILAGPGVWRSDRVQQLEDLATLTGVGVINSFGGKGLLRWDHPSHLGTVGLQADDRRLSGIDAADLVIRIGVDPLETPDPEWSHRHMVDVAPSSIRRLGLLLGEGSLGPPTGSDLFASIAAVVRPAYEQTTIPVPAPRAVRDLRDRTRPGVVVADGDLAGFWVARALPTESPGSVVVPAVTTPGFAAAAVHLCTHDGTPVRGVSTTTGDAASERILAAAPEVASHLEQWCFAGSAAPTSREAISARCPTLEVDGSLVDQLVATAGQPVVWGLGTLR